MDKSPTLLEQFKAFCQLYLVTKAPFTLPPKAKEVIVKIAPWATVVAIIVTLPLVLAVLGLGVFFSPFMFLAGAHAYGFWSLSLILFAVTIVLEIMAIPGLFKRQMRAWDLMMYVVVIHAVGDLLQFDIVAVLLSVVSLYILFQIKPLYK